MRYIAVLLNAVNEIANNRVCIKDAEKTFKRLIVVDKASSKLADKESTDVGD